MLKRILVAAQFALMSVVAHAIMPPIIVPQTISGFKPASPLNYNTGLTFGLSATGGSSGNPVAFTSGTPSICTVSGATATVLGPGTCTIAAQTYAAGTVAVSPMASSGLPVTFTSGSTSMCDAAGPLYIEGTSTCTITAAQAGNSTYLPAVPGTRSFTIAPASQMINFSSVQGLYVDPLQTMLQVSATTTAIS